jgi:hypothetical protein
MGRLSAAFVKADKAPGRYADGNGLYLVVARCMDEVSSTCSKPG